MSHSEAPLRPEPFALWREAQQDDSAEAFVRRVDAALYLARGAGRNRLVQASGRNGPLQSSSAPLS